MERGPGDSAEVLGLVSELPGRATDRAADGHRSVLLVQAQLAPLRLADRRLLLLSIRDAVLLIYDSQDTRIRLFRINEAQVRFAATEQVLPIYGFADVVFQRLRLYAALAATNPASADALQVLAVLG